MSKRSRDLPRRSVQVVPGSNERFLEKAPSLGADAYVLDLEDSVAAGEKSAARGRVVTALTIGEWGESVVSVRVNACESEWIHDDLSAIVAGAGSRIDAVVLPKVERPNEIEALDGVLGDLERAHGLEAGQIGIEVLIESAAGLVAIDAILAATKRIETVIFGPLDFAASLGIPSLAIGQAPPPVVEEALVGVRTRVLISGRAAGLVVIDGPHLSLDDEAGIRHAARASANLGFDGKWSIHPNQVETLNSEFAPTQAAFDRASALVERFTEASEHESSGAVRYEGAMIDEATRKLALALVRRGERASLKPSSS